MEVQALTVMACPGWGYCIAILGEDEDLVRVSEEFYLNYEDSRSALLTGSWTPA